MTNENIVDGKIHDAVNHPTHYTQYPVEVIELTRHMNFGRGNSVKYIARAGFKGSPEKELEDLKKARWYLDDEIKQVELKLEKAKPIRVDGTIHASSLTPSGSIVSTDTGNTFNTFHIKNDASLEDIVKRVAEQAHLYWKLTGGK